jgi:O-antigen ligase
MPGTDSASFLPSLQDRIDANSNLGRGVYPAWALEGLLKTGANRLNMTPETLLAAVLGGLVTTLLTIGLLRAYSSGITPSPTWVAPLAIIPLYYLLRPEWPEPLPAAQADPLDRLALVFMSMAMLFMTMNGVRAGGSMAVSDAFLLLAFLAAVPSLFSRKLARPFMLPPWLTLPAGALVFVGLVSMVFMGDSLVSLAGLLRMVAALLLVPLTIGMIGGTQRTIVWLVDLWIVSAMINAAVAVGDYGLHLGIGERVTHVISAGRSTGLTTHSNHLGVVMCMTTPLILARMVVAKTQLQRLFFFVALCGAGLAVLSTGSRGALVAFGVAAILGTMMLPWEIRWRTWKVLFIAGLAGMLLAGVAFRGQALNSFKRIAGGDATVRSNVSESDRERAGVRAEGIHQFIGSPIVGAGLVHARDAHLIYLQLAASSGLIGLSAFLAFFLGSIMASRKRARAPNLPLEVRAVVAGAGASVAVWAILGLVENQIADRYLYVPSGLVVAGIWYGVRNISAYGEQPSAGSSTT